jgi:hypothetical protein
LKQACEERVEMLFEISRDFIFYPWEEECTPILKRIEKLPETAVNDPGEMRNALALLEWMEPVMANMLFLGSGLLDEEDRESLLKMYRKQLDLLRIHAGASFGVTEDALSACTRLFQCVHRLFRDSWNW